MTNRIIAAAAIDRTLIANSPRFNLCSNSNAARISEQSLRGETEGSRLVEVLFLILSFEFWG